MTTNDVDDDDVENTQQAERIKLLATYSTIQLERNYAGFALYYLTRQNIIYTRDTTTQRNIARNKLTHI